MPRTPDPLETAVKDASKRLARAEKAYEKADAVYLAAGDELTEAQDVSYKAETALYEAKLAALKPPAPKGVTVTNSTTGVPAGGVTS